MTDIIFSEKALKDLENAASDLRDLFLKHVEKIGNIPPRRHMKYGIPHHVENVTRQARIIYQIKDERVFIIRCFIDHKEYERWFRSYK